jgi:hypothetical protein
MVVINGIKLEKEVRYMTVIVGMLWIHLAVETLLEVPSVPSPDHWGLWHS